MATATQDTSDQLLLNHLRKAGAASIQGLSDLLGVSGPAVRQRLNRLMAAGLIDRVVEKRPRGRPTHSYRLTDKGQQSAGDLNGDLAGALWDEISQIEEESVRLALLQRLAGKLAANYEQNMFGSEIAERMQELKQLMEEKEIPFDVDESGQLPVLTALACPYPDLVEQDRNICKLEQMVISKVVGETMKLSECRLDGGGCCSFTPEAASEG